MRKAVNLSKRKVTFLAPLDKKNVALPMYRADTHLGMADVTPTLLRITGGLIRERGKDRCDGEVASVLIGFYGLIYGERVFPKVIVVQGYC